MFGEDANKLNEERTKDAYSKRAREYATSDKRRQWQYMVSKLTADDYLIYKIDINEKRVLNVGTAPHPLDEIKYARLTYFWVALDVNKDCIFCARKIIKKELSNDVVGRILFVVGDSRALPFKPSVFDIVSSFSTIEHIPDRESREISVLEMSNVTARGGYVIITTSNLLNIPYVVRSLEIQRTGKSDWGFESFYTPWELKRLMKKTGLKPLYFSSNFMFTPETWFSLLKPFLLPVKYLGFRIGFLAEKL